MKKINMFELDIAIVLIMVLMVHGERNEADLYVTDYLPVITQDRPLRYHNSYHYQYQSPPSQYDQDNLMHLDEPNFIVDYPSHYNNRRLDKNVLEFLDTNQLPKEESNLIFNKRVLSSFRERMEHEKSKEQQEKLAAMFLQKLQEDSEDRELENEFDDNRNYIEMIEDLWQKYKNSQYDKDVPIFIEDVKKRQLPADYSTLGWSGIGYKKRSAGSTPVDLDVFNVDYNGYPAEILYAKRKRFPVAKRSSNFYPGQHKRAVTTSTMSTNVNNKKLIGASGTDPKVVQDLSHLFGNKENASQILNESKASSTSAPNVATSNVVNNHIHKPTESNQISSANENESNQDEPLNIKKKSIDWSNYFGIDRRKKKSQLFNNDNDINNDWLINRYNKVVAMAVKRSSEYPLNIFRNYNSKKESELAESEQTKKLESKSDETKLRDMDDKLKNIEDLIIDEALKYTGAHDGETDSAKIQEIKDKVISRLAAAYSLEKMRKALSEFKSSLAAQKYKGQPVPNTNTNNNGLVTKQFESTQDAEPERDNPMKKKSNEMEKKCTSDTGCEDQNAIDTNTDRCNIIEKRCQKLMNGGYSGLLYSLCKWHQLCYLCQDDIDMGTCDLMFLSRADALCRADVLCQWAARPALAALRQLPDVGPLCDRTNVCAR